MDYLKVFLPIAVAVIAWFANERRKQQWEEYQRKEDRYQELIKSIKGFYLIGRGQEESKIMKNNFIDQLNLCWMYCPDEVIIKAYKFIDTVHTGANTTDEEKEFALGDLMLSIRMDLVSRNVLSKTDLKPNDFRNLSST